MEGAASSTVCVTGATGFIGSWLVMKLLEKGYSVRATVRDPGNMEKVKHLLEFPNAKAHLTLSKADLIDEGSFDEVLDGCIGVFHVASPMELLTKDPENEMIKPTVNGVLNIMRSCIKVKTVRRFLYTSSTGSIDVLQYQPVEYDESCWTDVDFCRAKMMPGWMYFIAKTLAEKTAWEFATKNNIDLITIIPSFVLGPVLTPTMPPSLALAIPQLLGLMDFFWSIKQLGLVHLDDLCDAHIFLMEHNGAKGRYICSSHCSTVFELGKMLKDKYPEYSVPTQ
ncbi:bifunctional dihydroflavonol 4-reductase/flavanone 4-reductase-like [Telopea speciosissima]|uniref:bifunctional dihydroflavonol 4-reductase/flavanone 4-reductase-like n=1 Tax=Telopea speciosissima TaxID=54955 RepID=UPI001CC7C8FE|nr:bifunctional dihydroflavonol 4-reductase/flavanone 4-reductase-like [Telopea speciosissima]